MNALARTDVATAVALACALFLGPGARAAEPIFQDDFSTPNNRWTHYVDKEAWSIATMSSHVIMP